MLNTELMTGSKKRLVIAAQKFAMERTDFQLSMMETRMVRELLVEAFIAGAIAAVDECQEAIGKHV